MASDAPPMPIAPAGRRGGAVWQAAAGLKLRAAGYSGMRLPTLDELYRPFVVFPVTARAMARCAPSG